ncbi:hypothetical protein ACWU37_21295 (plasmid) [Photobacterium damselae subsp. damselae]
MSKQKSLVYGTLTQDTFTDFVSRLKHGQSDSEVPRHCTSHPVFSVQEETTIWRRENSSCYTIDTLLINSWDGNSYDNYEQFLCSIEDNEERSQLKAHIFEENVDTSDLMELAEAINNYDSSYEAEALFGEKVWRHINTHLTKEAAEAFISRKKHDYGKLRTYVLSAYWCWELQAVIDGMCNGSIQYVDLSINTPPAELQRHVNVLQSLLAEIASNNPGLANDPRIIDALLLGKGEN